jgi:hypothetical protein
MRDEVLDELMTSLRVISMIKEGQKVSLRNGVLSLESGKNSVLIAIKRWINSDNRQTTLHYIRNVINNAIDSESSKLKQPLFNALVGLNALTVTYSGDAHVLATINVLEDKIKHYLNYEDNNQYDDTR